MTAQVVTITEKTYPGIREIVWDWLSTDAGAVSSTSTKKYTGHVVEVLLVPDGGGTTPSDLYDVSITDGTNDVLFGQGSNTSNGASVALLDHLGWLADKSLTLTIVNAGDAKGGLVYVYVQQ